MKQETKFKKTEIEMIPEDWVKYNLKKLRNEGKIKRVSLDKGRYWEVFGDGI